MIAPSAKAGLQNMFDDDVKKEAKREEEDEFAGIEEIDDFDLEAELNEVLGSEVSLEKDREESE